MVESLDQVRLGLNRRQRRRDAMKQFNLTGEYGGRVSLIFADELRRS